MKLQNIFLLSSLLSFQAINASAIKHVENNDNLNYNFYCIKDNDNLCSKLHRKLTKATNALSKYLDIPSQVNFDVFVDDVSKYRKDHTKESLAVVLKTDFTPLNPNNNNTISPYPNAKKLKRKLKLKDKENVKDRDFIILLNSFKSDKKYLKTLQDDQTSLIAIEIYEGLMRTKKIVDPMESVWAEVYKGEQSLNDLFDNDGDFDEKKMEVFKELMEKTDPIQETITLLNIRKDPNTVNDIATKNEIIYQKTYETNKLYKIMNWKDTLISKGKMHFPRKRYEYKRIVAVGDIHGDYDRLVSILRHAKLIDRKNNWIGTDSILVQIGDLTDRGFDFKEVIDLLMKLREQARKRGGIVYMLLGNHEINDMQGSYYGIPKSDFDKFGGYLEREKALSKEGKYGELLRNDMNVTMIIDDNIFVHAALKYKYAQMGIEEINKRAKDILYNAPSFDVLLNDYYEKNMTHPLYADPIFDQNDGILWSRFYIDAPEEEICEDVEKVLKLTKAKRIIVGHNIQEYGKINTKCQDKLILIDIALSKYIGNYFGYVEILNNKKEIWARYQ